MMELICNSYSCKRYYLVKPVKRNVECYVQALSNFLHIELVLHTSNIPWLFTLFVKETEVE